MTEALPLLLPSCTVETATYFGSFRTELGEGLKIENCCGTNWFITASRGYSTDLVMLGLTVLDAAVLESCQQINGIAAGDVSFAELADFINQHIKPSGLIREPQEAGSIPKEESEVQRAWRDLLRLRTLAQ